ncbi:hypothetical protein ZEAMMB73_Zm00001d052286 [Zea mays]|uniref:Uncharacterized protein n=1 Tax=Zea mays TaxID=4577 RepID=A0A1D6QF17_MAIZE|nr:hypothetical protein ZEAMMB73_Zm00001d052286 [Zea mays]
MAARVRAPLIPISLRRRLPSYQ